MPPGRNPVVSGHATLGILAGGGTLPREVADAALSQGRRVFVVCLDGFADPDLYRDLPHARLRIGAAGAILDRLAAEGVGDVVMVGPVRRPALSEIVPDARGARLIARAGRRALLGDDSLLRAVVGELEAEGFRVIGYETILGPDALMPPGHLAGPAPDGGALADIARGASVLAALGAADVGQAVVVQQGLVLAIEAIEGTDSMIARAGTLARQGSGGVLVKLAKPGQEERADRPTIGADTITVAAAAGLRGIAAEAGAVVLAQRRRALEAADTAGLFLIGVTSDGAPAS